MFWLHYHGFLNPKIKKSLLNWIFGTYRRKKWHVINLHQNQFLLFSIAENLLTVIGPRITHICTISIDFLSSSFFSFSLFVSFLGCFSFSTSIAANVYKWWWYWIQRWSILTQFRSNVSQRINFRQIYKYFTLICKLNVR